MFHHIPFQDFIIVWVYLMNWLTGNYPELVCQHGCRSVMARHSSQTDKLLCCQSDHQTKQIVKVINGKKKFPISSVWRDYIKCWMHIF